MGRTNPTFHDLVTRFEDDWQLYRRMLRCRHQPHFDTLIEHARNHAGAGGTRNPVETKWAILVSICLAQQRELAALRERVDEVGAMDGG